MDPDHLEFAGDGADVDGPLFRPLKRSRGAQKRWRLGLARGYSAHSKRATFIATALENRTQLEAVRAARPEHHEAV